MRFSCLAVATLSLLSIASFLGCSSSSEDDGADDALTSRTALERKLAFEGVVYVAPGTANEAIVARAENQAKTAFGALRTSGMMASTREMHAVDPATFKTREVRVVDAKTPDAPGDPMLEVRYTYTDQVLVEEKAKNRTSYSLAVLSPDWESDLEKPTAACVDKEREDRQDSRDGFLWYYFNPTLDSCRAAMKTEQAAIDRDKAKLEKAKPAVAEAATPAPSSAPARIPKSQIMRRYYPTNVALETVATHEGATYPEYDKLFRGGVEANKLKIGVLVGRLEHEFVPADEDGGYWEWLSTLDTLFTDQKGFTLKSIEPQEDLANLVAGQKTFQNLTFNDYIGWTLYDRYPTNLNSAQKKAVRVAGGAKLDKHFLTFEKKVKVAIGNEAPRDFVIQLNTYFGVETDVSVYKRMMKTNDVFVYNGHSYLGDGPLDPSNFTASDFPSSYQLWFLDGCISYNYYNHDYFPLKGGAANLDLILNGFEAPADYGGQAEAKLLARLISGKQPSYKQLLLAAQKTDPLRVVDGESDNKFSPTKTKIVVTSP